MKIFNASKRLELFKNESSESLQKEKAEDWNNLILEKRSNRKSHLGGGYGIEMKEPRSWYGRGMTKDVQHNPSFAREEFEGKLFSFLVTPDLRLNSYRFSSIIQFISTVSTFPYNIAPWFFRSWFY